MKTIRERLENWAAWSKWSDWHGGADSMTGAVCERMRKAALGNVWSGVNARHDIDEVDAARVELAWRAQTTKHRDMLLWTYINNARPEVVCRKMRIPARPISIFIEAFRAAELAIENTLDKMQREHTMPRNNLIPSDRTSDSTKGAAFPVKTESPA